MKAGILVLARTIVLVSFSALSAEPAPSSPALPALATDAADLSNPAYLLDLANVHLKYNAVQRARPFLRKALELSKDTMQRETIIQSVKPVFQRTGNWKEAVELYQDFLPVALNASERGKINVALADACVKAGDVDRAEALLIDIFRAVKDDQNLRQQAQNALTQLWQSNPARVDPAIAQEDAWLAKDPNDAAALELLILIYSHVKHDNVRLTNAAERLCALRPDDSNESRRLAGLYLQDHKYDSAIEIYKNLMKAATRNEESQQYCRQIGTYLIQAGKKDEAVTWMHANFEPSIKRPGDFNVLASWFEAADLPIDAEMALNEWLTAAPTPEEKIEAYFRLAQLAFKMKNYPHAEETLRTLATDYKDNQMVQGRAKMLFQRIEEEKKKVEAGAKLGQDALKAPAEGPGKR